MTKSDDAYKSISEVARILELINKKNGKLNTHTIRTEIATINWNASDMFSILFGFDYY